MQEILKAIMADADAETFAKLKIPATYRAAHILKSEEAMFAGVSISTQYGAASSNPSAHSDHLLDSHEKVIGLNGMIWIITFLAAMPQVSCFALALLCVIGSRATKSQRIAII